MKGRPRYKDGTIDFYWHDSSNDLNARWGEGVKKVDVNLLFNWFGTSVSGIRDEFKSDIWDDRCPVLRELEARGYDISTLRFTIKKKKTEDKDA
jgi:hypothetical protein